MELALAFIREFRPDFEDSPFLMVEESARIRKMFGNNLSRLSAQDRPSLLWSVDTLLNHAATAPDKSWQY